MSEPQATYDAGNGTFPRDPALGIRRMTIADIAAVAHHINAVYCLALGDDSQPVWEDAPEWQRESAIKGVQFHLDNPNAGPEASHESWLAQKVADGWVYGPVKNAMLKTHPCIVPFSELPREQQAKDFLFRGVVRALERHLVDER